MAHDGSPDRPLGGRRGRGRPDGPGGEGAGRVGRPEGRRPPGARQRIPARERRRHRERDPRAGGRARGGRPGAPAGTTVPSASGGKESPEGSDAPGRGAGSNSSLALVVRRGEGTREVTASDRAGPDREPAGAGRPSPLRVSRRSRSSRALSSRRARRGTRRCWASPPRSSAGATTRRPSSGRWSARACRAIPRGRSRSARRATWRASRTWRSAAGSRRSPRSGARRRIPARRSGTRTACPWRPWRGSRSRRWERREGSGPGRGFRPGAASGYRARTAGARGPVQEATVKYRGRILVADDDLHLRELAREILERDGHTVACAPNAKGALAKLGEETFDLLLADLVMPDADGLWLLREAKRIHPELEVMIVTGFGGIDSAVSAIKEGAYDYITKPFHIDKFSLDVQKALEKKRLSEDIGILKRQIGGRDRFGFADRCHRLDAGAVPPDRAGGAHAEHDPDPRRVGNRQGSDGPHDPRRVARAAAARSSPFPAARFRPRSWRASCSATRAAPSRARSRPRSGCSRRRRGARSSSTRSARPPRRRRSAFCGCCRSGRSAGWAARRAARSTSG